MFWNVIWLILFPYWSPCMYWLYECTKHNSCTTIKGSKGKKRKVLVIWWGARVMSASCWPTLLKSAVFFRNISKPAEKRVVVLTRGLGEGSVQQAPCNIYQLSSSSREEKEERGREKRLSLPPQKPAVDVFKLPLMLQTLSRQPKK